MMLVNFYVVGYISPGWIATGIHILVLQWVLLSVSYSTPFHSVPYVMLWKAWNKGSAGLETLQLKQSSSCQLLPSTVHTIVRPLVCERVWNKCGIRSLVIEASSFCHFFVSTAFKLLNQLLWLAREFLPAHSPTLIHDGCGPWDCEHEYLHFLLANSTNNGIR